ncbi:hypothetical protein ACH5RR_037189 [Cinchona calisaya]|uniref:Uncharacterized protein n=1 Tax=Cinchona calisaya TaxID=153742 RepID=A0ABD2Y965_9GENT
MVNWIVEELQRNSSNRDELIEEIVRIEKKIFPKHESLARLLDQELKKRNSGLLYSKVDDGDVAGYVMYSWPSSLSACITKLAGSISTHLLAAYTNSTSIFLEFVIALVFLFFFLGLVEFDNPRTQLLLFVKNWIMERTQLGNYWVFRSSRSS